MVDFLQKKHARKTCVPYEDAVEEALCFGWIDSKMKRIDDEKFILKFSPRKRSSIWSELNRKKAEKMIKEGKMTKAGLNAIEESKKNGRWESVYTSKRKPKLPVDLKKALKKDKTSWENFNNFANSYQVQYIFWINNSKQKETREKRIKEVVMRAIQNKKPRIK